MICRTPQPIVIEGTLSTEALKLHDSSQETDHSNALKRNSLSSFDSGMRSPLRPLSQWDCLTPRGIPQEMQLPTQQVVQKAPKLSPKTAVAHSSTVESSRFLRFIRRMESAGPKIVLDRLKEEWQEIAGEEVDEEVSIIANCMRDNC